LALNQYEDNLCPCGCGYPSVVSQAPENEDRFRMDLPIRCHARAALVVAQKQRKDEDDPTAEALMWEMPRLVAPDLLGEIVASHHDPNEDQ
jgi:hypothetical protein